MRVAAAAGGTAPRVPEAFPNASWSFPKLPDMLLYPTDIRRFGMLDALTTAIREFTNKWCASGRPGQGALLVGCLAVADRLMPAVASKCLHLLPADASLAAQCI